MILGALQTHGAQERYQPHCGAAVDGLALRKHVELVKLLKYPKNIVNKCCWKNTFIIMKVAEHNMLLSY